MLTRRHQARLPHLVLRLLLCMAFLAAPLPVAAAPRPAGDVYAALIAKYRARIPELMAAHDIPGVAVVVVDADRVLWAEGFRYTGRDRAIPVTADTAFGVQSISKTTAAPRALPITNCDFDTDQPKLYSLYAYRDLLRHYAAQPENLKFNIYPAGHTVTREMERDAVAWFVRHLRRES
jgi:hypothetical protein